MTFRKRPVSVYRLYRSDSSLQTAIDTCTTVHVRLITIIVRTKSFILFVAGFADLSLRVRIETSEDFMCNAEMKITRTPVA